MLAPAAITAASFLPAEAVESLLLSQELALSPPLAGTRQRGGLRDEGISPRPPSWLLMHAPLITIPGSQVGGQITARRRSSGGCSKAFYTIIYSSISLAATGTGAARVDAAALFPMPHIFR